MSDKSDLKKHAKPKRHLRNYLLDKKFQLTYALIIVVIAVLLTGLLGFLIYHQTAKSSELHENQANETINIFRNQSKQTITVFKEASKETEKVFTNQSNVTKKVFKEKTEAATGILNILAVSLKDSNPDLSKMASDTQKQLQKNDAKDIAKMAKKIEKNKQALKLKMAEGIKKKTRHLQKALSKMHADKDRASAERKKNNRKILFGVIIFSLFFIIVIFLYTIVLTHKVAGPLFKVSLYFKKMEDNNLSKIWPLRKGDQLQDFYHKFELAHGAVVKRVKEDIVILDEIIKELGDDNREVARKLMELKELKEESLGDNLESSSTED